MPVHEISGESSIVEADYTSRDTLELLTASFRYSRGTPSAQECIFKFLAEKYGDRFSLEILDEITPYFVKVAGNFVYKSGIHPAVDSDRDHNETQTEAIEKEVKYQLNIFSYQLRNPDHLDAPLEVEDLAESFAVLVYADLENVPFTIKRKSYERGVPIRYRSNLVDFGYLDRQPARPEIKDFFTSITEAYGSVGSSDPYYAVHLGADLCRLVGAHLAYNPDDAEPLTRVVK